MAVIKLDKLIKLEGIEEYKTRGTGRTVYVMQIVPSYGWPVTVRIEKMLYEVLKAESEQENFEVRE